MRHGLPPCGRETQVLETRKADGGAAVRRRRACPDVRRAVHHLRARRAGSASRSSSATARRQPFDRNEARGGAGPRVAQAGRGSAGRWSRSSTRSSREAAAAGGGDRAAPRSAGSVSRGSSRSIAEPSCSLREPSRTSSLRSSEIAATPAASSVRDGEDSHSSETDSELREREESI